MRTTSLFGLGGIAALASAAVFVGVRATSQEPDVLGALAVRAAALERDIGVLEDVNAI